MNQFVPSPDFSTFRNLTLFILQVHRTHNLRVGLGRCTIIVLTISALFHIHFSSIETDLYAGVDLAHKNTIVMMEIDLVNQKKNSQEIHPWDEMVNSGKLSSETNIRFFKGLHYIVYEGAYTIVEEDAYEQGSGDKEKINEKNECQSNQEKEESDDEDDEDEDEDNYNCNDNNKNDDDDEYEYEYEYEEDEDIPFFESFSVRLTPFSILSFPLIHLAYSYSLNNHSFHFIL